MSVSSILASCTNDAESCQAIWGLIGMAGPGILLGAIGHADLFRIGMMARYSES